MILIESRVYNCDNFLSSLKDTSEVQSGANEYNPEAYQEKEQEAEKKATEKEKLKDKEKGIFGKLADGFLGAVGLGKKDKDKQVVVRAGPMPQFARLRLVNKSNML